MKKLDIKFDYKKALAIVVAILLVAAHVGMIILISKVIRFYAVYPELFNYIIIILVCIFIIIDIVFVVGFVSKDLIQKIICAVMSLLIFVGSVYGTVLIGKTNQIVDNVVQTDDTTQYETVSGIFVTYKDEYKNVTATEDLAKYKGLKIGGLDESGTLGITTIGIEKLTEKKVASYTLTTYTNNTDLLFALIGGDIDVAIFSNMYKAIFRADENVDYTQYLDNMNEFGEFEKDIEVANNASKKNLSKDPFNVLLIGWSPIEGSKTVGLADAIIVATVNPQTYTVSMMSIARDSYVPISCYGGTCDKINSGRGTSMDCFVSTVETLIGEDIDFYMEINFAGFAILVDCLGGVEINNPVNFELDGIYVEAGNYVATGWQALEFARERHHMPNGDFDRQQHQKEVIMQIAKKFIKHDIAFALDIFDEISPYLNTNITFDQLASVFSMITGTKNYTGVSTFTMLDMHALRMTGYGSWHYNDDYELPLWIYKLYEGSIDESLNHMQEVMGNFKTIKQDSGFAFDAANPYVRAAFYSTEYDEVETHEELPPYYVNLTSMTYKEALEWAASKGATLVPVYIGPDDSSYDESLDGYVISQSVAYGKKVSKYPTCTVTVMGDGKKNVEIPDYDGWNLERAIVWVEGQDVKYIQEVQYVSSTSEYKDNEIIKIKYDRDIETVTIIYALACGENATPTLDGLGCSCAEGYVKDDAGTCKLYVTVPELYNKTEQAAKDALNAAGLVYEKADSSYSTITTGNVIYQSVAAGKAVAKGSTVKVTISLGQKTCGESEIPDGNGLCTLCQYGVQDGKCKLSPKETCELSGKFWNGESCVDKTSCQSYQTYNASDNTCSLNTGYNPDGTCANGYKDGGSGTCIVDNGGSQSGQG